MNLSTNETTGLELSSILQYQEDKRESLGRYISFSEAIAMWMSEQLKDQMSFLNTDSGEVH